MVIVILIIVGLSILILGHEAGHFLVARAFGLKVDEFGFGFPPRLFGRKKGGTEYSVNWLPFGGFVKIAGEEEAGGGEFDKLNALPPGERKLLFFFQPAWKRFLVLASGVAANFFIGWLLLSVVFMVGSAPLLVVSGVQHNSPAEKAGILPGDVIKNYALAKDFIDFVNRHRGGNITVEIRRGAEDLNIAAVPRAETAPDKGALGVLLSESGIERRGIAAALGEGFRDAAYASGAIAVALYALMKDLVLHGSLLAGVVGPVGIVSAAAETGRVGAAYLVRLTGLISLNLAVINLIPFPALDGGRLFLILVEKLKGSPIPFRMQAWANRFGLAVLLLLMTLLTIRDITQWF